MIALFMSDALAVSRIVKDNEERRGSGTPRPEFEARRIAQLGEGQQCCSQVPARHPTAK